MNVNASRNTFFYKPPESCEKNEFTFQSDLYQVGIILYELLGGEMPNSEESCLNSKELKKVNKIEDFIDKQLECRRIIEEKIKKGKFLDFSSLPLEVSNKLIKIIKKATQTDLGLRYKKTSVFLLDLHNYKKYNTDWKKVKDGYFAKKCGVEYKIEFIKGNYIVKKKTKVVWRKDKSFSSNLKEITKKINK